MNKINNLAKQIRAVYDKLPRQDKMFLGGAPFTSEIERELENYTLYCEDPNLTRARTRLGLSIITIDGKVCGYQSTTIMNNANPTAYELKYLKLKEPLNYVQLKTIFVDQNSRGRGYSERLLAFSLNLAKEHKKDWVCDVVIGNEGMTRLLYRYDLKLRSSWLTQNDTRMLRFGLKN